MKEVKTTLDEILHSLYSDESRLVFLRRIYFPGNMEVADKILAMDPHDISVLNSEMEYAKRHGLEDRFIVLAKKFVDYYIKEGFHLFVKDHVINWNNSTIADYAITRLQEVGREDLLESAAEIAKAFGREKEARKILERILDFQLKKRINIHFWLLILALS
jgi:ABC-type Fe3+-hydroxamate transport system substrate-binding protein